MELRARYTGSSVAGMLLLCLAMSSVDANYTLEVQIEGYQNPSHMSLEMATFRFGCCDGDSALPCESCENAFLVCIREMGTGELTHADCDLDLESTEIPADDDDTDDLMFVVGEDISGLPNPIIFSGDVWPRTMEILFTIYDIDGTSAIGSNSDVVDHIFIYPDIAAVPSHSDPFSEAMTYIGITNISHLQLAFRLTCGPDHYGPYCTQCIPANDSSGHYSCDNATGERLCLEGYQNPTEFCVECVPAENCSADGGYCIEPGECMCRDGYAGEDCGYSPCDLQPCGSMGTCAVNTSSVLNYTCRCQVGITGVHCDNVTMDRCNSPCLNGECVNNSCVCDGGYTGPQCEEELPGCHVECGDNGRCVEGEEGGSGDKCECDEGYTGPLCEEVTCDVECGDNGRCVEGEEGGGDRCECNEGYTGPLCEEVTCDVGCGDNGRCVEGEEGGGDRCECNKGYTGPLCEEGTCDVECGDNGRCVEGEEGGGDRCECDEGYTGPLCEEVTCDVECGDNGRCVEGEERGGDRCECDDGYTGELCGTASATGSGSNNTLLVIVVVVIGGVLVILISAVLIAICVLLCCGRKLRRKDDGHTPSPYETPFFRRWRGNGHASNNATERNFENPLYHEAGSISPTSPPLPPRPEHPYATLEDVNNPYAQIPADFDLSLDEKEAASVPNGDLPEAANSCHHICPPLSLEAASSPRSENPYMSPVNSVNPAKPESPMNSSTVLYAHIQ